MMKKSLGSFSIIDENKGDNKVYGNYTSFRDKLASNLTKGTTKNVKNLEKTLRKKQLERENQKKAIEKFNTTPNPRLNFSYQRAKIESDKLSKTKNINVKSPESSQFFPQQAPNLKSPARKNINLRKNSPEDIRRRRRDLYMKKFIRGRSVPSNISNKVTSSDVSQIKDFGRYRAPNIPNPRK